MQYKMPYSTIWGCYECGPIHGACTTYLALGTGHWALGMGVQGREQVSGSLIGAEGRARHQFGAVQGGVPRSGGSYTVGHGLYIF